SVQARLVGFETREAVLCRAAKAVDRAPHEVFARSSDRRRSAAGVPGSGSGVLGHWRSRAGKTSGDANPRKPREGPVARLRQVVLDTAVLGWRMPWIKYGAGGRGRFSSRSQ